MKDEVEAKLTAASCIRFPVTRRIGAPNQKLSLLPTESFLSDPSDGLIADDF